MEIKESNGFLDDFTEILIKKLEDLKSEMGSCANSDKDFIKGQTMGFYTALDILKTQADAFQIKVDKLSNVSLEQYLQK